MAERLRGGYAGLIEGKIGTGSAVIINVHADRFTGRRLGIDHHVKVGEVVAGDRLGGTDHLFRRAGQRRHNRGVTDVLAGRRRPNQDFFQRKILVFARRVAGVQ